MQLFSFFPKCATLHPDSVTAYLLWYLLIAKIILKDWILDSVQIHSLIWTTTFNTKMKIMMIQEKKWSNGMKLQQKIILIGFFQYFYKKGYVRGYSSSPQQWSFCNAWCYFPILRKKNGEFLIYEYLNQGINANNLRAKIWWGKFFVILYNK